MGRPPQCSCRCPDGSSSSGSSGSGSTGSGDRFPICGLEFPSPLTLRLDYVSGDNCAPFDGLEIPLWHMIYDPLAGESEPFFGGMYSGDGAWQGDCGAGLVPPPYQCPALNASFYFYFQFHCFSGLGGIQGLEWWTASTEGWQDPCGALWETIGGLQGLFTTDSVADPLHLETRKDITVNFREEVGAQVTNHFGFYRGTVTE